MTAPIRITILLALGFGLGAGFSILALGPVFALLCAIPLGVFSWFWILFGDVLPIWGILTKEGRDMMGPVLAGNSNLGDAQTQRLAIISEMVRILQALAVGFMAPILFGWADPVSTTALLFFLIPMIAWWIFVQVKAPR